ncbi:MAG: cyclophilin-like fold protein [Neisseria sp.]|nr:cyclophilin-like fold protein [Neisseria sp.]
MKIKITLDNQSYTATLADNPSAQALLKQLPLSLPAENYGGVEKIAYLPQKLPDSPNHNGNFAPKAGDVTYYAPWGNLALFHGSAKPARGLVYLGKFDSEFTPSPSAKQMRIERAE